MKTATLDRLHGIALIALMSLSAFYIAGIPEVKALSLSPLIIRKTKRFDIPERAVYFLKTKRTAGGTPPPQNIFDRLTPVFT